MAHSFLKRSGGPFRILTNFIIYDTTFAPSLAMPLFPVSRRKEAESGTETKYRLIIHYNRKIAQNPIML
jgi:hypothetical protein